ncbi:MAG TPA: NUDIX domain-containing protein [Terriglobia bacterium]|nr:NUDIX domain-containing protein [Terriglobia bacterium]
MGKIAIYDEAGCRIGAVEKDEAHAKGHWHRSVLLVVERDGQTLVYWRGADQRPAECWDLLGGHADVSDRTVLATAVREANEELVLSRGGIHLPVAAAQLQLIGAEGCLRSDAPNNREWTTVYVLPIPLDTQVTVQDEGRSGATVERQYRFSTITALRGARKRTPSEIADGLRRFLERVDSDREFRCAVYQGLDWQRWSIAFGCTYPDEPGCGCADSSFHAEHTFVGSFAEAEAQARSINHFEYYGDFRWWIEPIEDLQP